MPTATLAIDVNTPAPDFTLMTGNNTPVQLSQFVGQKNVVLFFVRTYSCYSCRQHVEHLARTYADFQRYETEVLVILNADQVAAKGYSDVTRAPFPVLADPKHEVYNAYGLNQIFMLSTRTGSVVVDKQGVVSYIRSLSNPWGWRNETDNLIAHLVKLYHPELAASS
jgi:peroxiredoxin